ncbi:MAG: NADPH-dependent glutamate synthase [Candidatus Thermoplasmatota archaeon]|nr:NADPH-dependent glutamate synthase [Candidatus Thermoplasmatota archaeon]
MKEQDPKERIHNFNEVPLGFSTEDAIYEAQRCLECKTAPCVKGCPAEVKIPEFIDLIVKEDFAGAYQKILETNSLPAVCGRVCPQETQCQGNCVFNRTGKPINIGKLERFVADYARKNNIRPQATAAPKKNKKIAIIGSGPAGLTCASDLIKAGYDVTIFEALHRAGGVLVYGIPEFRLPKSIIDHEIEGIKAMGVNIATDFVVGATKSLDEISDEFDGVFVANGAGSPKFMGIQGENLNNVYSANEFLTRSNLMKAYLFPEYDTPIKIGKKVAVIGGGNVTMDSARTALRLGAEEVHVVYRRTKAESPARIEEIEHAEEEGVIFDWLTLPVRVLGDEKGNVTGMECIRMELGEPDASGRRRPVPIEGSNFVMECDQVIDAIGTQANPLVKAEGMKKSERGYIIVEEESKATTRKGIFAGGDIARGSATVILAIGDAKKAARAISATI